MKFYYQFRFRRLVRRLLKIWAMSWYLSRKFLRTYIFSRTKRLRDVRRFMLGWLALFAIAIAILMVQTDQLKSYYLVDRPSSGGAYIEGTTGKFGPLNPLLSDSQASNVASALIFSGLFKSDGHGQLAADLAESWKVSKDGTLYTVKLRDGLRWQDGQPLTANDVVFTVRLLRDPNVASELAASWRGVTVSAESNRVVTFRLPSPYAPFLNLLTVGLLPGHILASVLPSQLRLSDFNQLPVGSGPFSFDHFSVGNTSLFLKANPYYVNGSPNLSRFVIQAYDNYDDLYGAEKNGDINGVGGFGPEVATQFDKLNGAKVNRWPIDNETLAFFNIRHKILGDVNVRQAMVQAVDQKALIEALNSQVAIAKEPLLPGQLGYDPSLAQLAYAPTRAKTLLTQAGWRIQANGPRAQKKQPLELTLVSQNSGVYPILAKLLQSQWQAIGIKVDVELQSLDQLQQGAIKSRNYDILLQEISIGTDPDVYAFWDSDQALPPGLNLSGYKSSVADAALEAGRTRLDPKIRAAKYHIFLKTWRTDAPAVALFRPYYYYSATSGVAGIDIVQLGEPLERFWNVANWSVTTEPALKRLAQ